nr:MAG TPA: hypothetical protein [Caudoviricetes sp.]
MKCSVYKKKWQSQKVVFIRNMNFYKTILLKSTKSILLMSAKWY